MIWPREYSATAFEIWKDQDRQAAIDYLKENCPKDWQKLAFTHTRNSMWLWLHNARVKK